MSPLFFASMAPLLAKTPPVNLEINPSGLTIEVRDGVSVLEHQGQYHSSNYVNLTLAPPEFLERSPSRLVASTSGKTPFDTAARSFTPSSHSALALALVDLPLSLHYIVQPGDTLWAVAQQFNLPLQVILEANPDIVPEELPVGYKLVIPRPQRPGRENVEAPAPGGAASPEPQDPHDRDSVPYQVRRGDTIWAIAQRFDVPPQAILDANPGTVPKQLQVNQTLAIPVALHPSIATHAAAPDGPVPFTNAALLAPEMPPSTGVVQPEVLPEGNADATGDRDAPDPATSLEVDTKTNLPFSEVQPELWYLGAIALMGLGITLIGWYGWQKRADLQAMVARLEQMMQEAAPSAEEEAADLTYAASLNDVEPGDRWEEDLSLVQGAIASHATPSEPIAARAIGSKSTTLFPQLLLQLTSFFGELATHLPLPSPDAASSQTSEPKAAPDRQHGSVQPGVSPSTTAPLNPLPPSPRPSVQPIAFQPVSSSVASEVMALRLDIPQAIPEVDDPDTAENWSTPIQNILDQPPSSLPQQLIAGGMLFCVLVGAWAWVGTIEEVGYAQGQLVPQGEMYEVEFPESGRVRTVAVKEGEAVKAGQVLFELDTQVAESEVRRLQDLLSTYEMKLQEKQGLIPKLQQESDALARITQTNVEAQFAAINQVQANASTATSLIHQLELDATAQQERLQRIGGLVNEGALSREYMFQAEQALRERQRNVIENQGVIHESQSQINQLQAEVGQAQAEGQRQQIALQQQLQQLQAEIVELQAQILNTKNLLNQELVKLNQRYLYAPVDGIVSSLQVVNEGAVVQPGETIAEIIPDGVPLILSAVLPSKEAGFVQPGMPVQIKLDAYPFQDFGVIPGTVEAIAPNTENHEQLGAVYRVEISLDRDHLRTSNQNIQFKPGSTAQAEIVIRRRRIADVLLDPIKQLQTDGLSL